MNKHIDCVTCDRVEPPDWYEEEAKKLLRQDGHPIAWDMIAAFARRAAARACRNAALRIHRYSEECDEQRDQDPTYGPFIMGLARAEGIVDDEARAAELEAKP